jgi:hypothetical protein
MPAALIATARGRGTAVPRNMSAAEVDPPSEWPAR